MHIMSTKRETIRKSGTIMKFKECIKLGTYYTCIVCKGCLYKRFLYLKKNKQKELINNMFHFSPPYGNNLCRCKTCAHKIQKSNIPSQAVCNKLNGYNFPEDLRCTS